MVAARSVRHACRWAAASVPLLGLMSASAMVMWYRILSLGVMSAVSCVGVGVGVSAPLSAPFASDCRAFLLPVLVGVFRLFDPLGSVAFCAARLLAVGGSRGFRLFSCCTRLRWSPPASVVGSSVWVVSMGVVVVMVLVVGAVETRVVVVEVEVVVLEASASSLLSAVVLCHARPFAQFHHQLVGCVCWLPVAGACSVEASSCAGACVSVRSW